MKHLLCRLFKHNFKYIRRYYRCNRCGIRRCDLEPLAIFRKASGKGGPGSSLTVDMVAKARDVWEHKGLSIGNIPSKEIK